MDRIPLLIDTDPGVDDALALLMAFNSPDHEVVGLTIAAGNVGIVHTVRNALKLCDVVGSHAPVFAGAGSPLLHPARDAAYVHGRDGFGRYRIRSGAGAWPEGEHAALALLRLSHEHAGRLVVVALGPLTNIALALKLDPTLVRRVARLVVMGGAVTAHGNITAAAEFNIAFDPEAAHIVFSSFPRIELADWEAVMAHGSARALRALARGDVARARFYDAISRRRATGPADRRGDHWHSADAWRWRWRCIRRCARDVERPMVVELEGRHARGATIVDWRREEGRRTTWPSCAATTRRRFETRWHRPWRPAEGRSGPRFSLRVARVAPGSRAALEFRSFLAHIWWQP
jgi:purine nucleosidase